VVIKSPGISRYRPAVEQLEHAASPCGAGSALAGGGSLERVTCITGTKGKSTTTAIAGHLLTRLGYDTKVAATSGSRRGNLN